MSRKLILFILFAISINANTLRLDDKISDFSLPNQFDKIYTVNSDISIIIVTFEEEKANLVNDFLSSKTSDFLHSHNTVFINDISYIPSFIIKMFTIPKLRDYKYDILLIYKENSKKFLEEENKITVYSLENGFVKDVKYVSTKYELEEIFK